MPSTVGRSSPAGQPSVASFSSQTHCRDREQRWREQLELHLALLGVPQPEQLAHALLQRRREVQR